MSEREPPPEHEVARLGCLMLNGVGDILCCLPALQALKERYSRARLVTMVRPHLAGLVESNPLVDAILPFGSGSIGARLAFLRGLRRERLDLCVDLHTPTFNTVTSQTRHLVRNALLMRWSGARYRRAYASGPLARQLTHPLAVPAEEQLREANVVDLTLALAWPREGRRYSKVFTTSQADRAWAARALAVAGGRRVGLYFGTRQPAKMWPEAASDMLARLILDRMPDIVLVLIGDQTDAERAAQLVARLDRPGRRRVLDFTGKTTLGQTAALISRLDAMVSSDSGPMHLADAVGVPMVALFSTHNYPGIWAPRNGRSIVIYHEIECGPCRLAVCPVGNRCMANITPEEVFAALARKLDG